MSLKTNITHNHSETNPTHNNNNYPKHKNYNHKQKNKDGYKYMCIIHNSPFLYAHSFSFLCCSPPNYVLLLSPFLARIAKGFLQAFVE